MHFDRFLAPADKNADIALFLPPNAFLADARAVTANNGGISFAGINNL